MEKFKQGLNEASQDLPQEIKNSLIALEKRLNEKYPIGIPRKEIGRATGGVLNSRTEANNDCSGESIPGRFKIGRQNIYPVPGVIHRLRSKMTTIHRGNHG